jgi:hypothetical protein
MSGSVGKKNIFVNFLLFRILLKNFFFLLIQCFGDMIQFKSILFFIKNNVFNLKTWN